MNAHVPDKQTAADLESARAAQKAAEIDHYLARIAHQRDEAGREKWKPTFRKIEKRRHE
ncbi:hypothetical protein [Burkholderia pseudomallei]|uniref:hypothetical protein n=1 Tax=Burkholderia pseudomallei TaxID=28450 RepID=UPI0012F4789E|nr:hypothetical protein [Burkholderia pseudomallei]